MKYSLTIDGDTLDDLVDGLEAALAGLSGSGEAEELSVEDLTNKLKAALPSMDITMTPKAGGKGKGKKKEVDAGEAGDDPFGNKPAEPAEPEQTPAEVKKTATDILVAAYNDKAKQPKVLALLKEFGVKKFSEVPDDKAGELLAKAKAL